MHNIIIPTYRLDDGFLQVVDLLVVKVIFQVPINWFEFLIHTTLRVVADVLESQSMTYNYVRDDQI